MQYSGVSYNYSSDSSNYLLNRSIFSTLCDTLNLHLISDKAWYRSCSHDVSIVQCQAKKLFPAAKVFCFIIILISIYANFKNILGGEIHDLRENHSSLIHYQQFAAKEVGINFKSSPTQST